VLLLNRHISICLSLDKFNIEYDVDENSYDSEKLAMYFHCCDNFDRLLFLGGIEYEKNNNILKSVYVYANSLEEYEKIMDLFDTYSKGKERVYYLRQKLPSTHDFISAMAHTYMKDVDKKKEKSKKEDLPESK